MNLLIKIDRLFAWILFICLILYFVTGYGMTKGIINPSLASKLHLQILTYIVITAFVIHTSFGIHLAFKRWQIWNLATKILLFIFYAVFVFLFVWVDRFYVKQYPAASNIRSQNNTANSGVEITLNLQEVTKHNSPSDCWMVIANKVYDLTNYLSGHPGGTGTITSYCGKDSTNAFATKDIGKPHSQSAENLLSNFYLGDIGQIIGNQQVQKVNSQSQNIPKNNNNYEYEDD